MDITQETLIEGLKKAVPDFTIDDDWAKDQLGYLIINELGRYICREADFEQYLDPTVYPGHVRQALAFLEACLEGEDPYMRDLVHECLEALKSCERIAEIKTNFGPRVHRLWKESFEPRSNP